MIDQSKLARQEEALTKWRNKGGIGTLDIVMRFGKTRIGMMAIDRMIDRNPKLDVIVVTPSVTVHDEWLSQMKDYGDTVNTISAYVRVYTANQLLENNLDIKADLLIIDEVHKFTSDKRVRIIKGDIVKYKFLMCLTGSMPGGSMREKIVSYAPIVDTITEKEALEKHWISQFIEFNIPLEFPDNDKDEYLKYSTIIKNVLNKFKNIYKLFRFSNGTLMYDSDFDLILSCYSGKSTTLANGTKYYMDPQLCREGIINKMSWNPDLAKDWSDEAIKQDAYKFNKAVSKRNDLLINNIVKLNAVMAIFKANQVPTICFNESTDFADVVSDAINNNINRISICYHSNIKSGPIIDPFTGQWIKYSERSARRGQIKNFGKDSLRKLAIEGMTNGTYKFLSTARAFDEGLTIPNLEQVITTAGTANPMQYAQRNARGKTVDIYNPNKVTRIYNLYFDDFYILNNDGERELIKSRDKTKLYLRQDKNRDQVVELYLSDLLE